MVSKESQCFILHIISSVYKFNSYVHQQIEACHCDCAMYIKDYEVNLKMLKVFFHLIEITN